MQDDVLLPHLTVYESMKYAAQLKLPRKTPKSQRELVVREKKTLVKWKQSCSTKCFTISPINNNLFPIKNMLPNLIRSTSTS